MNISSKNLSIGISVLFGIILGITAVTSLISRLWEILLLVSKRKILLPPDFRLATTSFILATQYFGEIKDFYIKFWWWDLLLLAV